MLLVQNLVPQLHRDAKSFYDAVAEMLQGDVDHEQAGQLQHAMFSYFTGRSLELPIDDALWKRCIAALQLVHQDPKLPDDEETHCTRADWLSRDLNVGPAILRPLCNMLLGVFIAEASRNLTSLLSGLILFDLIDGDIRHDRFDWAGLNLNIANTTHKYHVYPYEWMRDFDWAYRARRYGFMEMFFLPLQSGKKMLNVRSTHPMTRGGSYQDLQAEEIMSRPDLSIRVRRQETDLLLRWLFYSALHQFGAQPEMELPSVDSATLGAMVDADKRASARGWVKQQLTLRLSSLNKCDLAPDLHNLP